MKTILELIKEKRVYFDGGTGTVLPIWMRAVTFSKPIPSV